MPILVTGDLHWNDSTRDRYRHDFVGSLESQLIHHKVSTLLILGDLTEEKDRHSARLVHQIFDHISRLAEICPVIILKGNHDYLQPSMPFFKVLDKLPKVRWINNPRVVYKLDLPGEEGVLFLPHTRNHKADWKAVDVKAHKYVFAHQTFKGAKTELGFGLGGIPRSVFKKSQTVISGDVHVPQTIGSVTYVGAPYPINFGDTYEARMLLIYGTGTQDTILYNGPRKVVMDMELGDRQLGVSQRGDLVKVNVHLKTEQRHAAFLEYKEWLVSEFDRAGSTLCSVNPIVEKGDSISPGKRRKLRRRSDDKILGAYAVSRGAKKATIKTGRRLMRKV